MDHDDIRRALDRLGLTPTTAGKLFRHSRRAVERWCYGDRRPPQGIVILLHLMLAKKITARDIEIAAAKI